MPPHAKESSTLVVTTSIKAENNNKFSRMLYPPISTTTTATNYQAQQARHNNSNNNKNNKNNNIITKKRTSWFSSSSSSSSSSSASTTAKKSVHFNESVRCQKVLHIVEYTKEERADSWYTSCQMSNMKQAVKEDAMKLEVFLLELRKCHPHHHHHDHDHHDHDHDHDHDHHSMKTNINDNNFCARGLEHRTQEAALARFQNRCLALHAVLDEQQRQDEFGIYNPEQLARCYRSETSHCQGMAHEIGMDDEYNNKNSSSSSSSCSQYC
jgi:hypothetical protein